MHDCPRCEEPCDCDDVEFATDEIAAGEAPCVHPCADLDDLDEAEDR